MAQRKKAQARPSSARSHAQRKARTAAIVAQVPDDARCTDCVRKIARKNRFILSDARTGIVSATLHAGCYVKRAAPLARRRSTPVAPARARRRRAAPDLLDETVGLIGDAVVTMGELAFEGLRVAAKNPDLVRLLIEQSRRA
jgi:hypothetical protein